MASLQVLPAPSSKLGRELLDRLVAADVLTPEHAEQLSRSRLSEQLRAPAAARGSRVYGGSDQHDDDLRTSLATAAIARGAGKWKQRRVAPKIQARMQAQRFIDDARERTRGRAVPNSNVNANRVMV